MATMDPKNIRGLVGNIIMYTVNGETRVRARPGKYHQADVNKKSSKLFALVAAGSAPMIRAIRHYLPGLIPDNGVRGKLIGWIRKEYEKHGEDPGWLLGSIPTPLYNINPAIDLRNILLVQPQIIYLSDEKKIQILFPAFHPRQYIIAPRQTTTVILTAFCVSALFAGNPTDAATAQATQRIDYLSGEEVAFTMELPMPGATGEIALLLLGVQFAGSDNSLFDIKAYSPFAVMAIGRV
jgi:hypothetical protein